MTDDLARFEELATEVFGFSLANAQKAIIELVAMVREAREGNHTSSEHEPTWAELVDYWKERAEAAERELAQVDYALNEAGQYKLTGEDASFADRIAGLHSNYLRRHKDACEAKAELAELKRKMREPDEPLIYVIYNTYEKERSLVKSWLAAVNHLLGEKE